MAALDALLSGANRAIVVSDSVFSMDGDAAPVDDLIALSAKHGALLVLDEAHAVLGPDPDTPQAEVIRIGTLSKFVGSFGGFAAGSKEMMDLLVNRARPFIFTTASPPANAAAALAAVELLRSAEGDALKDRLRYLIARIRPGHRSPIIPFIVGSEVAAAEASDHLLDRGLLVPAIRPPSVPEGSARLRVTVSAAHTNEQVDMLIDALRAVEVTPVHA